jgi:hypothetical protein
LGCIIRPSSVALNGAVVEGPMAALDDRSRPGKEPTITIEAKAWLTSLACRKAKELGYPHELWTTRLLARHAREHGPAQGHVCLANLAQGTVCKILDQEEVKPHKVRYYLEQRDPEFVEKMAPQNPRCGLPGPHGNPFDPRQSFRACLAGNPSLVGGAARRQI